MTVENMGGTQNIYRSSGTGAAWRGVDTSRSTSGRVLVGRRPSKASTTVKPLRLQAPKKSTGK